MDLHLAAPDYQPSAAAVAAAAHFHRRPVAWNADEPPQETVLTREVNHDAELLKENARFVVLMKNSALSKFLPFVHT